MSYESFTYVPRLRQPDRRRAGPWRRVCAVADAAGHKRDRDGPTRRARVVKQFSSVELYDNGRGSHMARIAQAVAREHELTESDLEFFEREGA